MEKLTIKRWIFISLLFFLIAASIGAFLRMTFFTPVTGVNYKFFLHAHSHVAFLGWMFNILYTCLVYQFIQPEKLKHYKILFVLFQVTVIGMLILFPIQGYDTLSITFSTAHIFLSWWFAWKFYNDTLKSDFSISALWIKWALVFMVISSLGPFALGYIISQGLSDTYWYELAIYYYLHFQYNGWFVFVVFGLFFASINDWNNSINRNAKILLILMVFSGFLSLLLSALWIEPPQWIFTSGQISAVVQLISLYYLFQILKNIRPSVYSGESGYLKWLFIIAISSFVIKVALQFLSSFEIIAIMAYENRNLIIAYLHMIFLGFTTFFVLGYLIKNNLVKLNSFSKSGIIILIIAFFISEMFILLPPLAGILKFTLLSDYFEWLFYLSIFLPMGILLIFLGQFSVSRSNISNV